tara:strand:+ start:17447 stop:17785 length:339 start_codon:yes stop_codon:yes gene_type:complete
MNSCCFVGRLGRDSELKNVNDSSLLVFNVASDVGYGDKKNTIWIECNLWGKRANTLHKYLKKGTTVTVFGELSERHFTGNDGVEKKNLALKINNINFATEKKQNVLDDEIPF